MKRLAMSLALGMLFASHVHAAPKGDGTLTMTFSGSKIEVSGITPGAKAVIYGVVMLRIDYGDMLKRYQAVVAADAKGMVTYDLGRAVPTSGVWIAVDAASGDYAVGAPGRKVAAARVQQQPFGKGHSGAVDTFTFRYPTVDMVYVHPGHGVWLLHGVGGTPSANDGHYETGVNVAGAVSLLPEGEAKPKEFVAGGTLVAVDVLSYEVFALRLTGEHIGGAQ